jgi:hypothetical protein
MPMPITDLAAMCGVVFLVVFALLGLFALAIHVIVRLFPEGRAGDSAIHASVITAAVAALLPGARVTRIEEER